MGLFSWGFCLLGLLSLGLFSLGVLSLEFLSMGLPSVVVFFLRPVWGRDPDGSQKKYHYASLASCAVILISIKNYTRIPVDSILLSRVLKLGILCERVGTCY